MKQLSKRRKIGRKQTKTQTEKKGIKPFQWTGQPKENMDPKIKKLHR